MVTRAFLASRHRRIPGVELVTLTRNADASMVTGVEAERRPLKRGGNGFVDVSSDELEFVLADLTCGGTPPKSGDVITDASSVAYTVLGVTTELLTTRHRCQVVRRRG